MSYFIDEEIILLRTIWRKLTALRYGFAIANVLILFLLMNCKNSYAENFSYMQNLKSAEESVGNLDIFSKLDSLSPAERDALYKIKGNALQKLMTTRSLAGDSTGAAEAFRWWFFLSKAEHSIALTSQETLGSVTAENALEAIISQAKNHQIVILNEAHQEPTHRVFAAKVAHELRKIGFSYLAGETFRENIPQCLNFVDADMGFYLREPMFGEFIRSAIKDKWNFVGYDVYPDSQNSADFAREREFGAAQNIIAKTFAKDPNGKILIYVGYGHARKYPAYKDEKTFASLASVLRYKLGIEPLTINQSDMFSHGNKNIDNPIYREVLLRFPSSNPIVLKNVDGKYAVLSGRPGYDMEVFHPDDTMQSDSGRPVWMQRQAGLHALSVPSKLLPKNGRRLIQAFHAEDALNATAKNRSAIPADMIMIEAGHLSNFLMLPVGEFHLRYED